MNAFQQDEYRPLIDRRRGGRVSAQGGCLPGGWLGGGGGFLLRGVYHVTYPIVYLMLPVCCPNTN